MTQNNPPSKKYRSPPHQQKDNATAKAIASLKSALAKEANANRNQEKRENIWDKVIQVATLIFVVLTTIGIFYQAKILNNTDTAMHASAKAAIDSTKAVTSIERPYLFVLPKPSQNISRDGPFPASDKTPTITYSITDLGRVPAIIRATYVDCFVDSTPPSPPRFFPEKVLPSLIAIGINNVGYAPEFGCTFDPPLTLFEWDALKNGTKNIYFVYGLVYEGALDATYISRAIFRIDPFSGKAFPVDATSYNYDRTVSGRVSQGISVPIAVLFN